MALLSERQKNQVKGALFEVIVRKLLRQAGYIPIVPDGIHIRPSDGHVRGRGYWHDIDALGRLQFPLFYMYPIRLLAEVKCYDEDVPIWAVRNFAGALKDISENYFVADKLSQEERIAYQRYTDCGSFFSATGCTIGAQRFALAQGIFLVSYENNPILSALIADMRKLIELVDLATASAEKKEFARWITENIERGLQADYTSTYVTHENNHQFTIEFTKLHNNLNSIPTSVIAMVTGEESSIQYPVHMMSNSKIPEERFLQTDTQPFKVYFTRTDRGLFFEARLPEQQLGEQHFSLFFSLPMYVYEEYFSQKRMLDFKMKFIRSIELPTVIKGIRRILRLDLDTEWVERQRRLVKGQSKLI